ncbi:regulatory protein RecX [Paenibacillus sp. 481]|uniref:regulatory protein RecX n=1 Tax=Paenibacillus sp. 481 TaxID=2835869 RepID=UPI001E529F70|nr:RecX family transcriptional regulator [Paenibacillus sp. 481]UHA73868.1 RecX family transcriptional regulator [Paenibacillus sp. 481]
MSDDRIVTIVRVERDAKQASRYTIHFDSSSSLNVHEDVMVKYRLFKGNEVSVASLADILRADELNKAYVQALKYLQRKPRTRGEMAKHLSQKEYEEGIVIEVLDRLQQQLLVDDQAYAHQWTEQRLTRHYKGRRWIQHELKQKGVHEQHIASALEAVEPDQEWESALHAARKKWRQTSGEPFIRKQKTTAFLMRRGYPLDMARRAAHSMEEEQNDEME